MDILQLRPRAIVRKTASSTSLASKDDTTDSARFSRKFGKHIQKRQLEIPEYAASFVDYKALKSSASLCQLLTACSSSKSSAAPP
jgi:CDK inhibitor PHO81